MRVQHDLSIYSSFASIAMNVVQFDGSGSSRLVPAHFDLVSYLRIIIVVLFHGYVPGSRTGSADGKKG